MDSGFDRFTDLLRDLPDSDDPAAMASPEGLAALAALAAKISDSKPSPDTIREAVAKYKANMDHDSLLLPSCGACGLRDYIAEPMVNHTWPYHTIGDDLALLRLTQDQVDEYLAVEEQYRPLFSIYAADDGHYYYLHDEFIEPTPPPFYAVAAEGAPVKRVRICQSCHTSLVKAKTMPKKERRPPKHSIANGLDFGKPWRIGLEPLTLVEQVLIARVSVDMVLVKLSPPTGSAGADQSALRGNAISFLHDGPTMAAKRLPDMMSAKKTIRVAFVGPDGKYDRHKAAAMAWTSLQVRPHIVYKWLRALKAVNPM